VTTAEAVRVFAPAKINLFLHVGEKRDDGYHALQSLVVFVEEGDALEFHRAGDLSLSIAGPFASGLSVEDNLVLKAARRLGVHGARIMLTKNLPVASGIGGGSADAAAALRGLRPLWGLSHPGDDFIWGDWEPFANRKSDYDAALALGSDVPVCLLSGPAWMEGRGDKVWSLDDIPKAAMVLVNPGVAVQTAEIFRRLERRTGVAEMIPSGWGHSTKELVSYLDGATNDLQTPACALFPAISGALDALASQSGALLSRMSGSGATCFAIFENANAAARAANIISGAHPDWWVRATKIASNDIGRPRPGV
jgi:4-diphosphocytidyl-2-C-methyl-D-erythritol kinase